MVGMGALMSSGIGAVAIIAGAAAIGIMAVAIYGIGKAMQQLSNPLQSFASTMPMLPSFGAQILDFGKSIIDMPIDGIYATADAMNKLAESIGNVVNNTGALTALPQLQNYNIAGIGAESNNESFNQPSNAEIVNRLDRLILLLEHGADIRINEKQIGVWLGKMTSKINSIEN
jgi:hypothetical protein